MCLLVSLLVFLLCSYSKVEGLTAGSPDLLQFTHLLISVSDYPYYSTTHRLLHKEQGLGWVEVSPRQFPPVWLVLEDKICVLERMTPHRESDQAELLHDDDVFD